MVISGNQLAKGPLGGTLLAMCLVPALMFAGPVFSQEQAAADETDEEKVSKESDDRALEDTAALTEDPEAKRREKMSSDPFERFTWPSVELYGSVRLHAINNYTAENDDSELSLGDGASRAGIRGEWQMGKKSYLFGRGELGFNILDTFTPKADSKGGDSRDLNVRLAYVGFDSDNLQFTFGKNWSAYYQIAGMADRFSIFGGSATGIYNAGTDGGATGTGRADDVLQARVFTNALKRVRIKPFNLNLQYQYDQPIPQVKGQRYGHAWGASAWLESETEKGIGLAYQLSAIDDPENPVVRDAGIDGDAMAMAVALRTYDENKFISLVVSRLDNIETTDQNKYINGYGAELYSQWKIRDRWWLVAGGNWLKPDGDDPDAGEYEIFYGVIGLRYTFDSFNRMLYAEYKLDGGTLWNGTEPSNELTLGVRWDFGY